MADWQTLYQEFTLLTLNFSLAQRLLLKPQLTAVGAALGLAPADLGYLFVDQRRAEWRTPRPVLTAPPKLPAAAKPPARAAFLEAVATQPKGRRATLAHSCPALLAYLEVSADLVIAGRKGAPEVRVNLKSFDRPTVEPRFADGAEVSLSTISSTLGLSYKALVEFREKLRGGIPLPDIHRNGWIYSFEPL